MIYQKNLYAWEQICRVFLGLALAVAVWWGMSAGLVSYLLIAGGVILAITGVVGFCPMCAMVGRRPVAPSQAVGR